MLDIMPGYVCVMYMRWNDTTITYVYSKSIYGSCPSSRFCVLASEKGSSGSKVLKGEAYPVVSEEDAVGERGRSVRPTLA